MFFYPTSTNRSEVHRKPGVPLATTGAVSVGVVNGPAVDTRYGLVQVQVRRSGGRVISAKAIDYPVNSGRDREINSAAIPILEHEAVASKGLRVDTVSGATFTSDGYRRSLQAALDAAP
jgi:uncharacterized protein with FMN-binding domain